MIYRQFDQKKIFILFVLLSYMLQYQSSLSSNNCTNNSGCQINTKTLLLPLSATQNLYSQYHKFNPHITDISITYRFQEAYNNDNIAKSIFQYNPLSFTGINEREEVIRPKNALIPEYFGLAPDTNTSLYLSPQIRNQIIDLQLAFQAESFWLQVNIPVQKAQWKVNKNIIDNNTNLGIQSIQNEGEIYIYNIGTTMNTPTNGAIPPIGIQGALPNGYNVLPPMTTITSQNQYNGAYIISDIDASNADTFTGETILFTSDLNQGSIDTTESLQNNNLTVFNELNSSNWKIGIGSWPDVNYSALKYQAAYKGLDDKIIPSELIDIDIIQLTGDIENVANEIDGEIPNTLLIQQSEIQPASSLESALSGSYTFNDLLKRQFGNFQFNVDSCAESWQLADIILWIGYDLSRCSKSHIGLYLHGVIPTGTIIDKKWNYFVMNGVVGNGHHYQFGVGGSASYTFCQKNNYKIKLNIDGYIDHVFSNNQFRIFDKKNQPMSRYAILKKLQYTGSTAENIFNDDYQYNGIDFLCNINNGSINIKNNLKGEAIIDLVVESCDLKYGIGYAFSGISQEILDCDIIKQNLPNNSTLQGMCYGYKGTTAITNIIIENIRPNQQKVTQSDICPLQNTDNTPCNYPLAYAFPSGYPNPNITTPGNTIYVKSCGDVTVGGNSGVYQYGESTGDLDTIGQDYSGTTISDVFTLPDIYDNRSGLMDAQILNRIFGHIDYTWETIYRPYLGLLGSCSFGSTKYQTPLYWDIGCYIGCSF